MDSGEVIPNLDEPWTLAGASIVDWAAGIAAALSIIEVFRLTPARSMPVLIGVLLTVTFGLATIKKKFPDRDRGLMNLVATKMGFAPPGIPTPADFQPMWSGAPVKHFGGKKEYYELGLDQLFPESDGSEEDQLD